MGKYGMKKIRIVYEGGEAEIEEKKSRFITTVQPVHEEQEALDFLAQLRKKYWNATHNCWAYVIGENQQLQRCSDDGEPQGTAGRPMLDVLLGEDVHDVIVVVTRYFGGTLLGTGGLVRAYSRAVQEGLRNSRVLVKMSGVKLKIGTDYNGIGKIQYILGQRGLTILDSEYTDTVTIQVLVPDDQLKELREAITEGTNGRARFQEETPADFAVSGSDIVLF